MIGNMPTVYFSPEESNAENELQRDALNSLTNLVMAEGVDMKFCNHINEANCNNLVDIAAGKSQYVKISFLQSTKMDEFLNVVNKIKPLHAINLEAVLTKTTESTGTVPMTLMFSAGEYISSTCSLLFDKEVTEKSITLHFNATKLAI